ncbi:DUF3993 domain-containing protein [Rossellomorea aquimaris]|uniref:DUF3993 domain-containing protein n=2 Tax=Bacillaceae TaxID=186817 RepID=A0A5D4U8Q5_9BACI|nr:DUF3993 domain-containing protein [Rossellomorea aquimaris]
MEKKSKGEKIKMMKKFKKLTAVLISAIFCIIFIEPATALDKDGIFERVETSFNKQVSLSEKPREMNEIDAILNTHFTESFKKKFVLENVIETDEGFQTFGSDFASYYIPNFSYTDKTEAVKKGETVYLYEYITYEEGPVYFEDGYQGVKLVTENGDLKVDDIFFTLPKELEMRENGKEASSTEEVQELETAEGEGVSSPLSVSYRNKLYIIFKGYFLDDSRYLSNII